MTIYRLGPEPDAVPRYRVDLGRILVTVDDIESLMRYLGRHEEDSDNTVVVEFDAGYFTEARDLSKINPVEMDPLRLRNSKVLVILGTHYSEAIGDFEEAQSVYNVWARSLRTKQKPSRVQSDRLINAGFAGLFAILSLMSYVASILTQRFYLQFGRLYLSVGSTLGIISFLTIAFSIYIFYTWNKGFKQSTYAIVVPHSRDEYRRNELSQKYPRRSWIVAIIAAAIAAISIAVNVWLLLTK